MSRKTETHKRLQKRFHAFVRDMKLTPAQAAALCGMTVDYINGLPDTLLDDLPEVVEHRMRLVAHIHEQLDMMCDSRKEVYEWMTTKHGVFGGKTPLNYLLESPFAEEALISLSDYLDHYIYRMW
ncbi:MAG: DUF2384 domain-containing protein [Proteobacteria bacterium]|nr:DUF2384 domain-containing protein [Pseudomonadota bacterium]